MLLFSAIAVALIAFPALAGAAVDIMVQENATSGRSRIIPPLSIILYTILFISILV